MRQPAIGYFNISKKIEGTKTDLMDKNKRIFVIIRHWIREEQQIQIYLFLSIGNSSCVGTKEFLHKINVWFISILSLIAL